MIKPWTDIMSKQEMIEYLRVYLKQRGYKKQKQTWHRINQDRVYVIVNVQNSQWDRETYYINLGAGIDRQSTMKSFSFGNGNFLPLRESVSPSAFDYYNQKSKGQRLRINNAYVS